MLRATFAATIRRAQGTVRWHAASRAALSPGPRPRPPADPRLRSAARSRPAAPGTRSARPRRCRQHPKRPCWFLRSKSTRRSAGRDIGDQCDQSHCQARRRWLYPADRGAQGGDQSSCTPSVHQRRYGWCLSSWLSSAAESSPAARLEGSGLPSSGRAGDRPRGKQTDDHMVADGPAEPLDEIATPETVQPPRRRRRCDDDLSGLAPATALPRVDDVPGSLGMRGRASRTRNATAAESAPGSRRTAHTAGRAKERQPVGLGECLIHPDQLELDVLCAARG